jgi:serine/threonine-protein kinase
VAAVSLLDWLTRKPGGPPASGARVSPKYTTERWLGGGGMAEVFLARAEGAEGFTRRVALKRVLPGFSEHAELARMFVSEAQLSSRLQHPNIVSVLDFDRDDRGQLFLVMELVDGVDLGDLLDTGALGVPLIIYLAIEILSGLRYAHDLPLRCEAGVRGIVHRDVSPHNVLLSWEGAVKVSDFGIAKVRAASHATATAIVRGKPAYMSPEQANGQALDGRSDLFAVGVMLWEMLCLRPLFRGSTAQETIGQMLFAPIASPTEVRPEVPEDLSRVVLGLLARDLALRTPSAAAAIAALVACADHPRSGREVLVQALADRFAGRAAGRTQGVVPASRPPSRAPSRPGAGGPPTLTAPPGVVLDPVARPVAPPVRGRRRSRPRRAWIALASLAVVAGLVGGGVARSTGRPRSAPPASGGAAPGTPRLPAMPGEPADPPRGSQQVTAAAAPALTHGGPSRPTNADVPAADEARAAHDAGQAPKRRRGSQRSRLEPGTTGSGSDGIREIRIGD